VQIISGVADTRETALALVEKYRDRHFVERAFEMAWFQSQEVLRHLSATEADAQVFGRLANSVIFGHALRAPVPASLPATSLGNPGCGALVSRAISRSFCCTWATSTASAWSDRYSKHMPIGA
jgi:hypothetical protein